MSKNQSFSLPTLSTSQAMGAGIAAGALALFVFTRQRTAYKRVFGDIPRVGHESDEIVLYGFDPLSDVVASFSPYVAKVEAWMRFVGLPYTKKTGLPAQAPRGQLPYIQHGDNVVPDSEFIIKYLQRSYPELDKSLSPEQEALSVIMSHFIEDSLYYGLFYHRWIHPAGWESIQQLVVASVPTSSKLAVRYWLQTNIRPNMAAKLHHQGLGRLSEADINMLLDEKLAALSQMLGEKPYLLGQQPCVADAAAFGFLDNALAAEGVNPELRDMLSQYSNLVAYSERIRGAYFDMELRFETTPEE